jgi:hypothetical protein
VQPDGWVALVLGGQYLRDDWIRVELAGGVRRHYAQKLFMTQSEISENRKTEYQQVCESHRTITDFRAKFLALLPIASDTGLFLVFKDGDKALSTPQVNAIGWLGWQRQWGSRFMTTMQYATAWFS